MKGFTRDDVEAIRASGLFDEEWYLEQYPDVKALGMDPAEHYLWLGARLGRNPSAEFDTEIYLEEYIDVKRKSLNPLLHFVRWGKKEGRPIVPALNKLENIEAISKKKWDKPLIIYESHNLKMQGAPNSLFEIARGIKERNKFIPFVMSPSSGVLLDLYKENGIPHHIHGISQNRYGLSDNKDGIIDEISNKYLMSGASLVHVNTLQGFHCILAAHRAGIPSIWNIRESEDPDTYYDHFSPALRHIAYSSFAKTSAVVFVAEATRQQWVSRLEGIVENLTITNGIDADRLMKFVYGTSRPMARAALGVGERDLVLLSVGTVSERKGQLDLAKAICLLDDRRLKNIVLAIAGFNGGGYSQIVREQLERLKDRGLRVIAVDESESEDERRRVAELYLSADMFILTSRIESYPRVILEAMEFRLPVISTPCFGVREQLIEGESVLFFDANDVTRLAGHIEFLCDQPAERQRLASASYQRRHELNSYDQMLDAYASVYERVLKGRHAAKMPRD